MPRRGISNAPRAKIIYGEKDILTNIIYNKTLTRISETSPRATKLFRNSPTGYASS